MNSNDTEDGPALPAAAIVAINQGRMIEAIRIVRESRAGPWPEGGQGPRRGYAGRDPMLKAQLEQRRAAARGKLIKAVLFIDLLLVVAIVWYFFGR